MPDTCCVPNCRGNYRSTKEHPLEKVSMFYFPSDDAMREKWMRMIPRKDLNVTGNTAVCEKHFSSHFIVREDKVMRPDGSMLCVPRKKPKLTSDAYPSLFLSPGTPAYLSLIPPPKRRCPDSRRFEVDARYEQQVAEWMSSDIIRDFTDLLSRIEDYMKNYDKWTVLRDERYLLFCCIELAEIPHISVSIRCDNSLHVDVFKGELKVDTSCLEWVIGKECKLTHWSQLASLLSHFVVNSHDTKELAVPDVVASVEHMLKKLCDRLLDGDEYSTDIHTRLCFLSEQFSLLFTTQHRYSPQTLLVAFRLLSVSRAAYGLVMDRLLILPHASYLRKMSTIFNVSGHLQESSHVVYLQEKCKLLQPHERHVILMLDEIHVKPKTMYKGGCLVGKASNSPDDEAMTVQAFMICSILSSNKDIAALVPVKSLDAAYLKDCTFKVLHMLETVGFSVVCIISDNNRVNRNVFADMCGGKLKPYIEHPLSSGRRLFFLFDSVHLLKCIRNNWLGQNDCENTFLFPIATSGSSVCQASFSHVRQLYNSEVDSVVKLAPGLTRKALYPSNLERQNVQLALKVFDEKVLVALDHFAAQTNKDVRGTQFFISVIIKLWRIINVKSSNKGIRKRDSDSVPITVSAMSVCYFFIKCMTGCANGKVFIRKQEVVV
jgi:hypothetical protein